MSANQLNTPFYRAEWSRENVAESLATSSLAELTQLLHDPALAALAEEGMLTLGMIKPAVGPEANNLGLDDQAAADEIEQRITGLGVLAKFSFTFDPEGADAFYDGPAKNESMLPAPPLTSPTFPNRWEEYKALMLSGPVTILLLYGPDAVQTWRNHLGHWNIVKNHDPATIRGALGVDNHNNLVHGSDSAASVLREIELVASQLERLS